MKGLGDWASLGLAAGTRCRGGGGGGAASAGSPFQAGVDGSRPKLAEALPRAAMAPGRLAACQSVYECECVSVCVRARARVGAGGSAHL